MSGRGPIKGKIALFWKGGRRRPSGRYLTSVQTHMLRVQILIVIGFINPIIVALSMYYLQN